MIKKKKRAMLATSSNPSWFSRSSAVGMAKCIEKCKVRLVAKGFAQKEGMDCKETFAPVAHHASKLLTCSMIASKGLTTIEFDIKAAFLTATVPNKCHLHLAPPPGMNM